MNSFLSLRSFAHAALFGSQLPFQTDPLFGTARICPNDGLSCPQNNSISDTCCINKPGGQFAQTQFWNSDASAGPPGYLGPNTSWTIHGLWPDHCDGRYDSVCDCSRSGDCSSSNRKCNRDTCNREYSSITKILQRFGYNDLLAYMDQHWKGIAGNEHLWQHEWSKHGTCVSTLDPKCYEGYQSAQEVVDYFQKSVELYKTLPTYEWLAEANILPSKDVTYDLKDIEDALTKPRGVSAVISCQGNQFREVWYHFVARGSVQTGQFVASEPNFSGTGGASKSCPDTGIRYLPKDDDSRPSKPTRTHTSSIPSGTSTPSGKGQLVVRLTEGSVLGCLIGNGKWYNTLPGSSCATFTSQDNGDSMTLESRKGPCGVVNAAFTCTSGVAPSKFHLLDGKLVLDGGETTWYAAQKPTGIAQESVYSSKHTVGLQLEWIA